MPYPDEDMLFLSGVQHYRFCPRQWALIHIDLQWEDNRLTMEGKFLHENVDNPDYRHRSGERPALRAVPVASRELGLTGTCDLIELHEPEKNGTGITVDRFDGEWMLYPIEYKHGKRKPDNCDLLQLTAQTMCIEEKYGIHIDKGAIYYAAERHRMEVTFTESLRTEVRDTSTEMHRIFNSGNIPPPKYSSKCRNCSIRNLCNPEITDGKRLENYIELLKS